MFIIAVSFAVVVSLKTSRCASIGEEMSAWECAEL